MNNADRWILQEKYKGKMTATAKKDIARLKAGEPLDHIIGFMEFLGCKILANKDALIPRVETEFWTEQAIEEIRRGPTAVGPRVLDMFAGSGAIGIAIIKHSAAREDATVSSRANGADNMGRAHIMRHVKDAKVIFAESEKEAVAQIKKNCALNKISAKRYKIIQSDIFTNISGKFDYILANPPYIPKTRAAKIQKSVIDYEPHAALFGGEDGLDLIRRFLAEARSHLNENGKIYMEFDSIQKNAIGKILKDRHYKKWEFNKDQYGKIRWVVAEK